GVRGNSFVPGLMNIDLGGYHADDLEIATAFDVNAAKVGRSVAEAIFAPPNNTIRFAEPFAGACVERGPTLDGLGRYMSAEIQESEDRPVDVAETLCRTGTDVLVSYLPVGSQAA